MSFVVPETKWDSSRLLPSWVYRSGDKIMLRLKTWELTYTQVKTAVQNAFPGREIEVTTMPYRPPYGGFSAVLLDASDEETLRTVVFSYVKDGETTILRKIPKYIPQKTEISHILTGTVQPWVTSKEIHNLFKRFSSDQRKDYPIVEIDSDFRATITFSDDPTYVDDCLIAFSMAREVPFKNPESGIIKVALFGLMITDPIQHRKNIELRRDEYLENLRLTDTAKYEREKVLRAAHDKKSRRGDRPVVVTEN